MGLIALESKPNSLSDESLSFLFEVVLSYGRERDLLDQTLDQI